MFCGNYLANKQENEIIELSQSREGEKETNYAWADRNPSGV